MIKKFNTKKNWNATFQPYLKLKESELNTLILCKNNFNNCVEFYDTFQTFFEGVGG